jgi:hypothetical protein
MRTLLVFLNAAASVKEPDLPQQCAGDGELDCDDGLKELNRNVHGLEEYEPAARLPVKAGRGGRTSPLSDDVEQSAKPRADRSVHFKRSGFVTVVEPSSPKVVALASTIACASIGRRSPDTNSAAAH